MFTVLTVQSVYSAQVFAMHTVHAASTVHAVSTVPAVSTTLIGPIQCIISGTH